VLGCWEENELLQLLTSLLLSGGFGVRIGDLRQLRCLTRHQHCSTPTRGSDRHRLSITPAGPRPCRTVLRDRLRSHLSNQESRYEILSGSVIYCSSCDRVVRVASAVLELWRRLIGWRCEKKGKPSACGESVRRVKKEEK
jgi:hypothetical protein